MATAGGRGSLDSLKNAIVESVTWVRSVVDRQKITNIMGLIRPPWLERLN